MDSVDSLDNVHEHSGQSPVSPWTKSSDTSQTGQWPCIQWTLSMEIVDSLDIVNRHPGQSPGSPDWTKSTVHGLTRHCPWTHRLCPV